MKKKKTGRVERTLMGGSIKKKTGRGERTLKGGSKKKRQGGILFNSGRTINCHLMAFSALGTRFSLKLVLSTFPMW